MRPVAILLVLLMLVLETQTGAQVVNSGGTLTITSNGAIPDAINALLYGIKADARSDSTCTITNANPGTISGCSTLNLTAADNGKLVRVVAALVTPSNVFTGCILSGGATTTLGTLVGGVCTSAAYTGPTTSNVFVQVATDDTAAMQSAINATYSTNNTPLRGMRLIQPARCIMISDTLNVFNKSGEWAGHGMFADSNTLAASGTIPGSCIIWAGPRGHPMVRIKGSFGYWMHDFDLQGNTNANNKPGACVDLENPSSGFTSQTSANTFNNIWCNSPADPDGGGPFNGLGPIPTGATRAFVWDPAFNGNNERDYLQHVMINRVDSCFGELIQQSAAVEINESTCANSGIALEQPVGGDMNLTRPQFLATGVKFIVGGGARIRAIGVSQQTTNEFYGFPQTNIEAMIVALGAHLNLLQSQAADPDTNAPPSGIQYDTTGVGWWPVYPGPSAVVQQNQLIQPPATYQSWAANWNIQLPNPDQWYANSPFTYAYIIKPVNNNPSNFYFRVGLPANAATGPGITGAVEPNWNSVCATVGSGCPLDGSGPGVQWINIGTYLMTEVIVPTLGNPGGYGFQVTTGGKTGAIQPPAWNQSVGGTTTDNTVTWTNIGVLTTNPNLWQFKETAAGPCTTGAAMPTLTQALNGTTTDNTCTWTTTLTGTNATFADITLRDSQFNNNSTQTAILSFNPVGAASTLPADYFECDACGSLAMGPSMPAPVSVGMVLQSYDGGLSTNGWPRTFIVNRRSVVGEPGANDVERITTINNHAFADMQHHDLTGKVSVIGQLNVNQIPTPTTGGGTCNVPAWVANQSIPANWTIKPAVGKNAGNFFFQNQGAACVAGATEPNPWNQTPTGTQADGTCTYTNVDNGAGVVSATNAGVYYIKYTERVGLPNATQGETLPVAERVVACGPTTSQNGVNISFTVPPNPGTDSWAFYVGTSAAGESLSTIVPIGIDTNQLTERFPVNLIVPPDWVATTVYNQFAVILPTSNNAGAFYYMASKGGVSGAARPGTFNQTIGTLTADSSESWLNIGLGAVPTANTTGILTTSGSGVNVNGQTSGAATLKAAAVAATPTITLPTVTTTGPTAQPGTSGMALVATTAGVQSYLATEAHLGNAGGYGNNTNFPTGNIVMQAVATNAGHFTQMTSTNQSLNAGSCSTAPTFNVFDGASNTGTAKIASATAQVTRATATTQAQTLTFAAGDVIGIYVSTQGATCLAPTFAVDATVTYP